MALQLWGEVIFERLPWSRSIGRFVEKHIRQWLAQRLPEAQADRTARYHVVFEKLNMGHSLGCHVEIRLGDEVWRGSYYAESPHQGLIHSLEHMMRFKSPSVPRLAPA